MVSVPTLQKKTLKEGGKSHKELIKISECNCILDFVLDRGSSNNDTHKQALSCLNDRHQTIT